MMPTQMPTRCTLTGRCLVAIWILATSAALSAQAPAPIDTSKIGPKVGEAAPELSGPDQSGVTRALKGAAGPKGTMLVFYRSADW